MDVDKLELSHAHTLGKSASSSKAPTAPWPRNSTPGVDPTELNAQVPKSLSIILNSSPKENHPDVCQLTAR